MVANNEGDSMTRKKDQALAKLKAAVKIGRDVMEFLKHEHTLREGAQEEAAARGMARAFLFENFFKSILIIVDDVIGQFEKYSKDRVANALRKVQVSTFPFISNLRTSMLSTKERLMP